MASFDIVASAENNAYMQWQAMMFHASCIRVQGAAPIIAVHKGDEPLLPGFQLIQSHGGRVQAVPNMRDTGGVTYPPRNTAAALRYVESSADYLVLCDSDMVFIKPLPLEELKLGSRSLTFDHVGYLDPDWPVYQPHIDTAFRDSGVDPKLLRNPLIDGGVPHVLPTKIQTLVGDEWLKSIDRFPIRFEGERPDTNDAKYADWPYRCYLASMWAMVMVKHLLDLQYIETRWCMNNAFDDYPMPATAKGSPSLLHYAYGSKAFNKRILDNDSCHHDGGFWQLPEDDGTIAGYLRGAMRMTGRFYDLS